MILHDIIRYKRLQLELDKRNLSIETMKYMIKHLSCYPVRDFKKYITEHDDISIIGEIKKASPSKGVIRQEFHPEELAGYYQRSGVQALSVLTEQRYFLGKDEYLSSIRQKSELPILRKDFIIDPWQIYQSRILGADAILLIVSILKHEELIKYHTIAQMLGMQTLVEVHDLEELQIALEIDAPIIGINNRNLNDFSVSIKTTERLIEHIPKGKVIVSESGISSERDVRILRGLGVNAMLIGEAFMRCKDINALVSSMRG